MEVTAYERIEPFVTKDGSTIREYLHTPAQSLAEATLDPGQETQRHYHVLSEEIYLIVVGGGAMEIDGETRDVGPGDAILIPPGAWHTLVAGDEGVRLLCMCVPAVSPRRHVLRVEPGGPRSCGGAGSGPTWIRGGGTCRRASGARRASPSARTPRACR